MNKVKPDIQNRTDIQQVMDQFYHCLLKDEVVGYIFTDVAQIHLHEHLPHIVDFWQNALFHTGGYKNNVTQIHKNLHAQEPLQQQHFDRWLMLLRKTVDEHYQGEIAEKMKRVAQQVGWTIQAKMKQQ